MNEMDERRNGRPVKEIVRGLTAERQVGGVWIVYRKDDWRLVECGRFTGEMPMWPGGKGPVSMILYDDNMAECSFLAEGLLEVFDERKGRR
jgi:hypothetical protein